MADSYVCSGATMRCTMGEMDARLTVLPIRTVFLCGKPMANISDHTSMVNLAPFGRCRSLGYPATASATAAHHGVLTPMPCVHNTPMPWMNGKSDYIIKGHPALLKSCKCTCMWGGTISITDDGQTDTGSADLSRVNRDSAEQLELSGGSPTGFAADTMLDGIQLALDLAGFAPGVGAVADLTNAAIYAARGDTENAALSLLAAVPGIGDAAAATKIVGKGVKMAKGMEKTTETTTKVVKAGEKLTEASTKTVKTSEKTAATLGQAEKTASKSTTQKTGNTALQEAKLKKLDPDAKHGGNEILYDTAQEASKQPKLLEITRRKNIESTSPSNNDFGQTPFGHMVQPTKTGQPIINQSNIPFGELTHPTTPRTEVPITNANELINETSKVIKESKPINADTLEEVQHTKEIMDADDMSRKFNTKEWLG